MIPRKIAIKIINPINNQNLFLTNFHASLKLIVIVVPLSPMLNIPIENTRAIAIVNKERKINNIKEIIAINKEDPMNDKNTAPITQIARNTKNKINE